MVSVNWPSGSQRIEEVDGELEFPGRRPTFSAEPEGCPDLAGSDISIRLTGGSSVNSSIRNHSCAFGSASAGVRSWQVG